MGLSSEKIKEILEGAPEGEEHVNFPICGGLTHEAHRLDDLREILTLRQRVEELEQERDYALNKFHVIADKHGEPDSYKCVVYDMEDPELKIKSKLKSMGWTPPDKE